MHEGDHIYIAETIVAAAGRVPKRTNFIFLKLIQHHIYENTYIYKRLLNLCNQRITIPSCLSISPCQYINILLFMCTHDSMVHNIMRAISYNKT